MPDWDELFAYDTVKMVRIRDRKLGILHYLFMFVVVLYVAFTVLYDKRYMITEKPVGSVRLSLLQGANLKPVTELPYCLYENQTQVNNYPNYRCMYWDESFVVFPETEEYSMFATSRVTITSQNVTCPQINNNKCKYESSSPDEVYYIGDIEHFTLLIDHSVYGPHVGITANARDINGEILDRNGKPLSLSKPNVVGKGSSDILELKTLLDCAGIDSLDSPSTNNQSISMRYDGIVLIVFITYSNTYTYSTKNIKYTLNVVAISNTKYKSVQPVFSKNTDTRILWNRHGIRMIFLQEGDLGKFDFQTLLLSFVSGLGLVTASTVVVDLIAFYILKPKKTYMQHRYEVTDPREYTEING